MNELDFTIKEAVNEPIKDYKAGSPEKSSLKAQLEELKSQTFDIPIIINGEEIRTGDTGNCVMPHNHQHILATYHKAGEKEVEMAISGALKAWKTWSVTSLKDRPSIYNKMAEVGELSLQVTETIKLSNGNTIDSVNYKTIAGINQVTQRTDTISTAFSGSGVEILKFVDSESQQTAGSFVKSSVKYIRITNLDSANYVDLYLIKTNSEETRFKLDAGKTFMLSNAEFDATATTDVVVDGYVDMAYFSDLINMDTIKAKADSSDVSIEYFVAST